MIIDEEDYIAHYGILRRSGRYPWGSGGNQQAINRSFLDHVEELRKQGMSEPDICRAFGIVNERTGQPSTTALRAAKTIAKNSERQANIAMAERLRAKGMSNGAIADRMGLPGESSVRALLAPGAKDRADVLTSVSNMLKDEVEKKGFIDVGSGVEKHVNIGENVNGKIGISKEKLNTAVAILREQGYEVHPVKVRQIGTGHDTTIKTLCPPGTTWGDAQRNRDKIQQIGTFSEDGGRNFAKQHPIVSIPPDRVAVRYAEEGGNHADGVIYVRPGVEDVSLGKARYAQVRVQVGDGHYLKGMAMYKDDLPSGVDLMFNTNKSSTGNKLDALKPLKDDPDLPFGSVTRPLVKDVGTEHERVTSSMNIVFEEGDWGDWSRSLSSQFLSKQPPTLAKAQLNMTLDRKQKEFDEIMSLTNPTIRRKLLDEFARSTDSSAVHLHAAALNQKQRWHAILPIESMKHDEIYAPNYLDGERVVLVRFPHGGTFEIPELTVNNKQREAKKLLGNAPDAVGIHHSVAQRLSGADFDGDTVIVIPNNNKKVQHSNSLEKLKGFDPVASYPKYEGMEVMTKERKAQEMGNISNLITDMTIRGASHDEIARAVRHSMVVIDAEKHELNWKQSALDNGISSLKAEYQGGAKSGASTLISKATARTYVPDRRPRYEQEGGPVNKQTGALEFVPTGKTKVKISKAHPDGVEVPVMKRSTQLAETSDAHTLVSQPTGTKIERVYADHSNKLKQLANDARLESLKTPRLVYSPSSAKHYADQVKTLDAKLTQAIMNRPLERQAQLIANSIAKAKQQANPHLDGDSLKKIKYAALAEARTRLKGAEKTQIHITQDEWNAIQAGAISNHKLSQILDKADIDVVKALATPRREHVMTTHMTTRARDMLAAGYTRADVARQLGVSLTTLDTAIKA